VTALDQHARPNRVDVDAAALRHNVGELRLLAGPRTRLFIALKGNACGFGVAQAAVTFAAAGADALATVDCADAVAIREAGVTLPILVYGGNLLTREVVEAIEHYGLMPSVHDAWSLEALARWHRAPVRTYVEVNVGGERLGVDTAEAPQFVRRVAGLPDVTLAGVHAHMHVPDGAAGDAVVAWQYRRFMAVLAELRRDGIDVPLRMIASSKTLVRTLEMNLDAIDPGHLAFGLRPTDLITVPMNLRPAFLALKSRLVAVRRFAREDFVDCQPFPGRSGMRFGVIPFGAADRLHRLNCGTVLVRGRRVPLLGAPSAEHARIDLSAVSDAEVGDEVVIIGRQDESEITLDEVRRAQGGVRESAITRDIPATIPRRYLHATR
jgi:alanine racemase